MVCVHVIGSLISKAGHRDGVTSRQRSHQPGFVLAETEGLEQGAGPEVEEKDATGVGRKKLQRADILPVGKSQIP